ncbi:transglycosylase domain-containing protein [Oceanobacillus sp. Castelsardo]|uniref:transglycosylase domain-containing protein n=1 Tax=Oceanobacillus sp. Castelsardo TaxID=1851204 RepID=UPI0009EE8439|nr:PBP1A family penicillin-binding protein [Oceanobacillus sp. Castelsardo]
MRNNKKDQLSIRHRLIRKLKKYFILLIGILLFCLISYGAIWFGGSLVADKEKLILDGTTTIETANGEIIGKLYNENRTYVSIDEIPEHVKDAFISIEDRRFYDHSGVDFQSVIRAVYKDILAMSKVEGASTITQQLAKNLFLYNDKTWSRKAKEVMAAIYLEQQYTKDELLELYLNEIYFGKGVYGLQTASHFFFSKSVSDLSLAEGAMLAGLAKAPNGYSPIHYPDKALKRRNIVLQSMEDAGKISNETKVKEQSTSLDLNLQNEKEDPWNDTYIDLVVKEAKERYELSLDDLERKGYRIVVNIDNNIQKVVYKKFQDSDYFPGNNDDVEGTFVMMEAKTGKIVASLGGRNYQFGNLNRVLVKRQPGSTFKPLAVYGPAMMKKDVYSAFSLIPDKQMDVHNYMVSNADNMYANVITIYDAIVQSKNTSAVWLLNEIGIDYSKKYLEKMGMQIDDDGLAIALGGLTHGVTPIQLMEGYSAFVNEGKVVESYTISRIYDRYDEVVFEAKPQKTEVFNPQVAWDMTRILSDTVDRGTGSAGEYNKALAGKTGSTEHPHVQGQTKDAWFVGYTPEYVSALWMGYDQSDEKHYLTGGSSYPTALTKSILTELDKINSLSQDFIKPNNVEDLPEPILLPEIKDVRAELEFGGISLVRGKISWEGSTDDRVVYRIYRKKDGIDERVGEVTGMDEFYLNFNVFHSNQYYVVPYDPLTKLEGKRSETVKLSW